MENKIKQNYVPWIIVGVVVIIFAIYVIGSNNGTSNQSGNSPTINSITNFFTPESDAQMKCRTTSKKAFDNWSGKLSKQFYDLAFASNIKSTDQITNVGQTANYKYNYNTELNICFMEYIFSWQFKKVSTGNEGQADLKIINVLTSDTDDPTTTSNTALAILFTGTAPSGSQLAPLCSVMVPGNYANPTQSELSNPTKCTSESEFSSLVLERFGIK